MKTRDSRKGRRNEHLTRRASSSIDIDLASPRLLPALTLAGKLAMADVFLIALYIVVVKGVGMATVETAWGLYLFTACILGSLALSVLTARGLRG